MTKPHDQLVERQFGAAAAAYVASAVHASGADLVAMAARAEQLRPAHALDLGTGGGHVAYALAPFATQVSAVDLSGAMLAAVRGEAARRGLHNITTHQAAAEALPFADGTFDFLACRFSTHHWHDAIAGLRAARRVLRAGAPALFADIVAPADAGADTHLQAVELLRDPSHIRDYRVSEWGAMLEAAGFTLRQITTGRLRMDFAAWVARMATPPAQVAAIRALQAGASTQIAAHFAIEDDGSFMLDTVLIEAI